MTPVTPVEQLALSAKAEFFSAHHEDGSGTGMSCVDLVWKSTAACFRSAKPPCKETRPGTKPKSATPCYFAPVDN